MGAEANTDAHKSYDRNEILNDMIQVAFNQVRGEGEIRGEIEALVRLIISYLQNKKIDISSESLNMIRSITDSDVLYAIFTLVTNTSDPIKIEKEIDRLLTENPDAQKSYERNETLNDSIQIAFAQLRAEGEIRGKIKGEIKALVYLITSYLQNKKIDIPLVTLKKIHSTTNRRRLHSILNFLLNANNSTEIKKWLGNLLVGASYLTEPNKCLKLFKTAAGVDSSLTALAEEINEYYEYASESDPIVAVCVLKGAVFFYSDLVRKLNFPLVMDFITVSSYGDDHVSSGEVKVVADLRASVKGRRVLLMDDAIDSGATLDFLRRRFLEQGAAEVQIAVLVNKPLARRFDVPVKFYALEGPDKYLVGYGFDDGENYRNLPDLCYIE